MSAIDRVRVMVLGDSGVGKTSFTNLLAYNQPLKSPAWTVGCTVEVRLHAYKEGTPDQISYFVELWDVGGSGNHRNARHVFYHPCHGVILVHDLTNRKSEANLRKWLDELLNREAGNCLSGADEWDAESFLGAAHIPMLVIGTKVDLVEERKGSLGRSGRLASQLGVDEIVLDCRQARYVAAGTSNAVKLTRFYDRVIEKSCFASVTSPFGGRYSNAISPVLPSKFYSPTHQD